MYCKYCGKEIPDDSVFCPDCGMNLEERVEDVVEKPVNPAIDMLKLKEIYGKLYKAQLISVLASGVLMVSTFISIFASSSIIIWTAALLSLVAAIVSFFITLFALISNVNENEHFKYALYFIIAHVILVILVNLHVFGYGYIATVLDGLSDAISLLSSIAIARSIAYYAEQTYNRDLVKKANDSATFYKVLAIIIAVFAFLASTISDDSIVFSIVELVAYIQYFILLRDASAQL